ncbi:MAG: DUF6448 family protein, partial [Thermoanaerobaculia bacterium]
MNPRFRLFTSPILFALTLGSFVLFSPSPLFAHCDTLDGPVVRDARVALEKGSVTPVLKWVRPADETEIRAAFDLAVKA